MLKWFAKLGLRYLELKMIYSKSSSRQEEANNISFFFFTCNTTVKLGFLQIFLYLCSPKNNSYFLPTFLHVLLDFVQTFQFFIPALFLPVLSPQPSHTHATSRSSLQSYPGGRHHSAVAGWADERAHWLTCSPVEQITPEFRQMLFLQRALI